MSEDPPPGFERHFRQSPLTEPWEPLWSRCDGDSFVLALHVRPPHTNARGLAHGGLISALADNAMGLGCGLSLGGGFGMVTVHLSIDFLAPVGIGQWVEITAEPVRTGRTLCFAKAAITGDGVLAARASAVFRTIAVKSEG